MWVGFLRNVGEQKELTSNHLLAPLRNSKNLPVTVARQETYYTYIICLLFYFLNSSINIEGYYKNIIEVKGVE